MLETLENVRARIGLIIPSSNRLTEPQMRRYAPPGVEIHVTRLRMTGATHVPLDQLMPRIVEATLALADARCDVIVFHCTASSMEAGLEGERRVLETMRGATAGAVATTASATLAALGAVGIQRLVLVSPYVATTHAHEIDFLTEAGVSVVGGRALGLPGSDEFINVTPAQWLRTGQDEMTADADGLFLSCTNVHTPPVIQPLESATGRPVVTSNQAVLWYALRLCGFDDDIAQLGRLFRLRLTQRSHSYAHAEPIPQTTPASVRPVSGRRPAAGV
jgi:maleate isomerase